MSSYSQTPAAKDNIVKVKGPKYRMVEHRTRPSGTTCQQKLSYYRSLSRMCGSWTTANEVESCQFCLRCAELSTWRMGNLDNWVELLHAGSRRPRRGLQHGNLEDHPAILAKPCPVRMGRDGCSMYD